MYRWIGREVKTEGREMKMFGALRIVGFAVALAATHAHAQTASSENYPQRPIQIIVGYAAGGGTDVVARVIAKKLGDHLGQTVIVENKTGAAGMIGAEYVARAKPDGYTLLFAASSMFTTNPVMYKTVPYTASNFVPISTVVTFPFFLLVNAQQPIKTVQELREYWKARPESANCSGVAGIHQLSFALLESKVGNTGQFIPYRGTNEAIMAVVAGNVLMTIADSGPASPIIGGGKVRPLAVTSAKRLAAYPNVPTFAESGLPGMEIESWFGLLAPAGTPIEIVKKLQQEVQQIVQTKDFEHFAATLNLIPHENTSEQFANMIASDLARWRAVAKASNIKPRD
jgi:tripartite-type tricarboxylate transporter receptor subunit TctC